MDERHEESWEMMIIVKFGGRSMRSAQSRLHCVQHIQQAISEHEKVVVVVSAMGKGEETPYSTDSLLHLTSTFEHAPQAADLAIACGELLATAVLSAELQAAGIDNIPLAYRNIGIITSGEFGEATIDRVNSKPILQALTTVPCVIVPGFQGINDSDDVMTLGRGGSDLTAIALGDALQAKEIIFYKDVDGIMTADPHTTTDYKKISQLHWDDLLPLLNASHPILQKKAALYAKKIAIPVIVRGIASTEEGTRILPS